MLEGSKGCRWIGRLDRKKEKEKERDFVSNWLLAQPMTYDLDDWKGLHLVEVMVPLKAER